jgi:arsenate reductase-like glutaredoxin family protein
VSNKIEAETIVDARKESLGKAEAIKLAKSVSEIYTCKGSKVVHIDLKKDKLNDDKLAEALLGPTGNLRAPTIKVNDTLLVGFNPELFTEVLSPFK